MTELSPQVRFRIDFSESHSLGPGKIELLEAVGQCKSLSKGARKLGMSYRRAWLVLDSLNHTFDQPVVVSAVGGSGGGGAKITSFGETLIQRYRNLEREFGRLCTEQLHDVLPRVVRNDGGATPLKRTNLKKKIVG